MHGNIEGVNGSCQRNQAAPATLEKNRAGICIAMDRETTYPENRVFSQASVSYRLCGLSRSFDGYSKQFPVTELGENHLSFLTVFPIRVRTRVSILYHSFMNPKESIMIEGSVLYCLAGRYPSEYRYRVCVLFDPLCVKSIVPNEDGEFRMVVCGQEDRFSLTA